MIGAGVVRPGLVAVTSPAQAPLTFFSLVTHPGQGGSEAMEILTHDAA